MTNIIILTGRAVQHPETKDLGDGKTLTAIRMVVSKDKDDKTPLFIDVSFTGKVAEIASKYVEKGRLITITGRLSCKTKQDKEGKNVTYYGVYGNTLDLLPVTKDRQDEPQVDESELPF